MSQGPRNLGTRGTVVTDIEMVVTSGPKKCEGSFPRVGTTTPLLPDVRTGDDVE